MKRFMGVSIKALAYSLPERKLTHSDLCARFGAGTMEKVARVSGILERRTASEQECASDFAFSAAKLLIEETKLDVSSIDLLIFATQTPDYLIPTTACILQERLGLQKSCAAFDLNLGCSQFIYALATASAWISSKMAKRALVLCGDTPTRLINPKDRSAASIFGDAACAILLEADSKNDSFAFSFGTDGNGFDDIICPAFGMRNRAELFDEREFLDQDGNVRTKSNLHVNGFKVFTFAYKAVAECVEDVLQKNNLTKGEIDLFVFHQAGEKIVSAAASRLGLDAKKVYFKMHDVGNCGGASVPLALADAAMSGRLKSGMRVLLCAFGAGRSWGAAILDWSEDFLGAFTRADFSDSPAKPQTQRVADEV